MCEKKRALAKGERRETTIVEKYEQCPVCGYDCKATLVSTVEGRLDDPDATVFGGMDATYEPVDKT